MEISISVLKGRVSVHGFRLNGSQTLWQQFMKYASKYGGIAVISPTELQTMQPGSVPRLTVPKLGVLDEYIKSFLDNIGKLQQG